MSLAQIHEPKLYFCVSRVENYVRTFPSSPKFPQGWVAILKDMYWPSPPGTIHILIGNFSYFVIRFLNHIFFCH